MGTFPFHDDKTPSLVVSPQANVWHCLGACNAGGSNIDWVMRTKGVSFRHAVELLRAGHPSLAAGEGRVVRTGTTAKLDVPVTERAGPGGREPGGGKAVPVRSPNPRSDTMALRCLRLPNSRPPCPFSL